MNAGMSKGLTAWKELAVWYDPRGSEDRPGALEKLISTGLKRAASTKEASALLQQYEIMLTDFETKLGLLDQATKMVGLKKLVPLELLTGRLRGERFENYQDLRRVVVDYITGRSAENLKSQPTSILMAEGSERDKVEDDKGKGHHLDDVVAAVMNRMGGKGKGNNGSKGDGKGAGGQKWWKR